MIKKIINKYFQFFPTRKKIAIVIIDDLIPSRLSPWRAFEFNEILKEFENGYVIADLTNFKNYSEGNTYEQSIKVLKNVYPELANKTHRLKLFENSNSKLFYTLFFSNVKKYFAHFEKQKISFAFTLYPGGGFYFHNNEQEIFLRKVFSSKYFKGVIVNQRYTYNYLIENNLCDLEKIKLIYGAPINLKNYDNVNKKDFKGVINVLFMANKYMEYGFDKGFDLFQLVSLLLIENFSNLKFHVVGNFKLSDLSFESLSQYFTFHGSISEENFGNVLNQTHICLSPNRPFALNNGAIDGFPLASSVTAGHYKNALFLTDVLNESMEINFIDGQDFKKIDLDPNEIFKSIKFYLENPEILEEMAENGHNKIKLLFSYENQITPRIEFLKNISK